MKKETRTAADVLLCDVFALLSRKHAKQEPNEHGGVGSQILRTHVSTCVRKETESALGQKEEKGRQRNEEKENKKRNEKEKERAAHAMVALEEVDGGHGVEPKLVVEILDLHKQVTRHSIKAHVTHKNLADVVEQLAVLHLAALAEMVVKAPAHVWEGAWHACGRGVDLLN